MGDGGGRSAIGQWNLGKQSIDLILAIAVRGLVNQRAIDVGGEECDEVVHVAPQEPVPRESDPGLVRREEMRRVDGHEITILARMQGNVGNDADAQTEADVCLDDIRIVRGERHVRTQPRFGESVV